jgi:uncharacterized protein
MDILFEILVASCRVFREAALYILLGLTLAGIMRVYITPESIAHYFRRGRLRSVLYASALGVPIPL